ncbi:MAG: Holliday junction branch migration protein RuvA [Flavobacteriales bacterium]
MYEYIAGRLVEKTSDSAIIDCSGVAYRLRASGRTLERIGQTESCKLLIHYSVTVDVRSGGSTHVLYGFADREERELFRLLIAISGVSAITAMLVLSQLSPSDIAHAIASGDWALFKTVKGIGPKLAQKIVSELGGKIDLLPVEGQKNTGPDNTVREESLSAMLALGFDRTSATKAINKILRQEGDISVEELIKRALKQL